MKDLKIEIFLIIGKKGKIYADFNDKVMKIFFRNKKKIYKFKFQRNEIFKNQIKYFIDQVNKNKKLKVDLIYLTV